MLSLLLLLLLLLLVLCRLLGSCGGSGEMSLACTLAISGREKKTLKEFAHVLTTPENSCSNITLATKFALSRYLPTYLPT